MEKKIPFASDVILIDAAFLDRVGKDMAAHFAPLVGRELPKADLAVLLECLVLDAGIEPGKNEIQVIFVYDEEHSRMNFCLPSDLEKEVHGMAFQSRLGEFALYAFQPSDGPSGGLVYGITATADRIERCTPNHAGAR